MRLQSGEIVCAQDRAETLDKSGAVWNRGKLKSSKAGKEGPFTSMTSPLAKESARRHPDSPLIQEGPIDLTCFFPISLKRPSRTCVEVKLSCLLKSHFAQIVNVLLLLSHLVT